MTAGDGLDREAIERRAAGAGSARANSAFGVPGRWVGHYADDVPALLAALKAAEARLRAVIAEMGELFGYEGDDGVQGLRAIAQYALRGEAAEAEVERLRAENARIKWDAARRSPMRRLRTEGGES